MITHSKDRETKGIAALKAGHCISVQTSLKGLRKKTSLNLRSHCKVKRGRLTVAHRLLGQSYCSSSLSHHCAAVPSCFTQLCGGCKASIWVLMLCGRHGTDCADSAVPSGLASSDFLFDFLLLGIEPRAWNMLGKQYTMELSPSPICALNAFQRQY